MISAAPYFFSGSSGQVDVTFDTLLRLSQDITFEEAIQISPSEQIENKFDYVQNATYGFTNNGIYILYYDTDLTIKEAL